MNTVWKSWGRAGTILMAVATSDAVFAQEPAADQPPVQAEAPTTATPSAETAADPGLQPVPDPAFGGTPPAAAVVVPGMIAPVPSIGVAAPSVVGEYRVGYIHRPVLSRIFWYSIDNPYVEQITGPNHARVFGTAHAPYYTTYRTVYNTNWSTVYVPQTQCYAPGAYGYTTTPLPAGAVPEAQYPNGPTAYAPYGIGSATYFGAYGPAAR
jgi:hypothetical protein